MKLRFVTTNLGKFLEVSGVLAPAGVELERIDRRYPEIQADDLDDVLAFAADRLAREVEPPWLIDDSGLFVEALHGFPGVYSSYVYRAIGCRGILRLMRDAAARGARFESAVLFHDGASPRTFRGVCEGAIARRKRGTGGFGFDPIFVPAGARRTFGEMTLQEKNAISHRGRAARALARHLGIRVPPSPGRLHGARRRTRA